LEKFTYLKSANADYIDEMLSRYQQDPNSVDPTWRYFFEGLELGNELGHEIQGDHAVSNGHANGSANGSVGTATAAASGTDLLAEVRVAELIGAYREFGRTIANINPLSPAPTSHDELELSRFGLTQADLTKTFQSGKFVGMGAARLSDIITQLKNTYCQSIAIEANHIRDVAERDWVQQKLESTLGRTKVDTETRKFLLKRVTEAETFERFLHTRYVAQKRFSLEGGETTIPALDCIFETGAELGVKEFVIGMAHRGRLNVLANLLGKKLDYILTEFEGTYTPDKSIGEGDVKYHMGFSADLTTRKGKKIHASLAYNPSHLEFAGAVVEGMARAKQEILKDSAREQVIPIVIHGDAAFAGQGVCYEAMQMSRLPGYATGGTLHIVINNQVGFTTSPKDARSTPYATDGALMLDCPIFHVNGDDAEAVWQVTKFCTEYRQKYKKDVFIDLICYRKHGHNEGDEPSFTQPVLYKEIKAHASPRDVYAGKLIAENIVTAEEAQAMIDAVIAKMTEAQTRTREEKPQPFYTAFESPQWKKYRRPASGDVFKTVETAVPAATLKSLAEKINTIPAGFNLHPKLVRFFEARLKAIHEGKGIDWGTGEALAYATLVAEGSPVRLSGQDAERGTFSHRQSVLNDFETGATYTPLNNISKEQALYNVYNSLLSETAVMGFDWGYSIAYPQALTIWEGQFGDFANGAQVIIDQFIATAESKWQRMSGLVLLLPHGYEGQAAEHSNARPERFLQLSGRENLQVCNLTTPAQLFHALRRQVRRDFRKPMVIMSPKSLLRHPQAISSLEDFTQGGFQEILDDTVVKADGVKRVLLCSGKIYYELLAERTGKNKTDTAIVRMEQLYPFPTEKLAAILNRYKNAKLTWVQEEPRNMGAWTFIFNQWLGGYDLFNEKVGGRGIDYIGREVAASPAVGSHKLHEKEQKEIIEKALS
jgi:2-oxoglutarate dehydrogenase E1 component